MSTKYKSLQMNSQWQPFIHKHKKKISRAVGKESMGEPSKVFKDEILKIARNEFHEAGAFSDRLLWDKIKREYFKL